MAPPPALDPARLSRAALTSPIQLWVAAEANRSLTPLPIPPAVTSSGAAGMHSGLAARL
jgi:hypothetical protein